MKHRYAVKIEKGFNIWDAWITTDVILYRLSKNGKKWKPIDYWSYDALISRRLSEWRAENKAKHLIRTYKACWI